MERRHFAQQDNNTTLTTCSRSNIVRRIQLDDLTTHGRPLSKCTLESTDTLEKRHHTTKTEVLSASVHCKLIFLLAGSENKLRGSFTQASVAIVELVELMSNTACRLFMYFGMSCGENRSFTTRRKRQMTAAQRKTRFRILLRSRQ